MESQKPIPRPTRLLGIIVAMVVVAVYAVLGADQSQGSSVLLSRLSVELVTIAGVACLMLAVARRLAGHDRALGGAWMLIGAGHLAYAAADLIAATGVPLTGGGLSLLMSVVYLSFYPLVISGVLRLPIAPTRRRDRIRVLLDLLVVSACAVIVLWYLLAEPLLLRSDGELADAVMTVAYLAGDVALFIAVLSIAFRSRRSQPGYPVVIWLGASTFAMLLADLSYAIGLLGQHDELHGLAGFGFIVSHLLAAAAAMRQLAAMGSPATASAPESQVAWIPGTGASLVLAYSSLGVACVVQMTGRRHGSGIADVAVSLAVVFLVAARQWLEYTENARLTQEAVRARNELENRVHQRTAELEAANFELEDARHELERRVAARTAQLNQSNQELEAFAYSVSHDLRAPLRGMHGFSAILEEDYGDRLDAAGCAVLARIRAAATRMGHLIDDLLRLSRISRAALEEHRIDLSDLARRMAPELPAGGDGGAVQLTVADGLEAWGDGRLIQVALFNLLGNACKFSAERAAPAVELGATTTDSGEPAFFIRDNGIGFDMAHAHKLFSPFERLHEPQRFDGSGIGLATVERIIRRHGGRVWAESAPDAGATFYFTLPGGPPH